VRRENETARRGNEPVRRGNETARRGNETVRRGNETARRGNETVRRGNEMATRKRNGEPRKRDDETRVSSSSTRCYETERVSDVGVRGGGTHLGSHAVVQPHDASSWDVQTRGRPKVERRQTMSKQTKCSNCGLRKISAL